MRAWEYKSIITWEYKTSIIRKMISQKSMTAKEHDSTREQQYIGYKFN